MARLRVQLTGFDEMLKSIEKAGGSVNKAVDECVKKTANIIDTELRNQMIKSKADSPDHSLVKDMDKPEISTDFKIICWSEEFDGKKKDAIKHAKELQ